MIRKKLGLKEVTLLLASAALVSVACSDDDDDLYGGGGSAGTAGSSSTSGKSSTGGSAGKSSTGGSSDAGQTSGGTSNGGSAGKAAGGTAGSENMAGETSGGVPPEGQGGEATAGAGVGGEGGAPPVELDTLKNTSFEESLTPGGNPPDSGTKLFPEWVNTSSPDGSSYVQWDDVSSGKVRLAQWNANAYTADTSQTVSPIANGTYSFSIMVKRDALDKLNESYLYAVGYDKDALGDDVTQDTDAAVGNTYVKVTLSPIVVNSGSLTVGVYTDAKAGGWINFDDAELTLLPE